MSIARTATVLIQLGMIAAALVVLPYKLFELDRYFVPKELALHVAAAMLAVLLLTRGRRVVIDAADALLALFLVLSAASALFATNYWLAQRALGLSVSSAVVFWAARYAGAAGFHRQILAAAAAAAVFVAGTSLAQAYGVESAYFSLNRAPGGTFGNRNFIAHFTAIALPALIYSVATARTSVTAFAGLIGAAVLAAALVLTRSRAGWLGAAAALLMLAMLLLASGRYWRGGRVGSRLTLFMLAVFLGASAAMILPNRLNWTSDSPYLDSARGVVDYRSGSGRGRVAQYRNSLRMTLDNPVLGVGPGNWPVKYVEYAPGNDRSLADDGMTANPWPSSDWVAVASERGIVAGIVLLGVFVALFIGSLRRWSQLQSADAVLARVALAATIAAVGVVGAFDAVLMLAAPSFLTWSVLGAASGIGRRGRGVTMTRRSWVLAAGFVLLLTMGSTARSAAQNVALTRVGMGGTRAGWISAAPWDPGSYRINQRVAELHANRGRCAPARPYARRAQQLFPHAAPPRRILRRCG